MTDHPRFHMIGGKSCLRHGHHMALPWSTSCSASLIGG